MIDRRRLACLLSICAATSLAACASSELPGEPPAAVSAAALGEARDGFPSWSERVVHVFVNRARADPAAELEGCDRCAEASCYAPAPPMAWSHDLARAARFHSDMLASWGRGLVHHSPCRLPDDVSARYSPGPCNGDPSCGCEGGVTLCETVYECNPTDCPECTNFADRVRRFGAFPAAENIAMTGGPLSAMRAWLTEPYDVSACGYGRDSMGRPNGHRYNILSPDRTSLGVGYSGSYVTQDFGGAEVPRGIVAGVHYPQTGPALEMRANWYDDAAPSEARVNVDGTCTAMTLERGTELNGTYLANVTVGAACTRYVFEIERGGELLTLPATGSYGVGCPEGEWSEARPPRCGCTPTCGARACGDDGCGGTCGTCAAGETCDPAGSCLSPGSDASIAVTDGGAPLPRDAAIVATDGAIPRPDASFAPPRSGALIGTCACRVGARASHDGPALLLLGVLALVLAARRRARAT